MGNAGKLFGTEIDQIIPDYIRQSVFWKKQWAINPGGGGAFFYPPTIFIGFYRQF